LARRRAAAAPAASPLLTDLVAYWNLDEASGTRADSHTNGLDLTDNNTVGSGLGVDGVSTAADFVAANSEYLSRAHSAALNPTFAAGFTVGFWFRPSAATSYGTFLAKNAGAGGPPQRQYGIFRDDVSNALYADIADDSGGSALQSGVGSVPVGSWTYVLMWFDPADDKTHIQCNNGTVLDSAGTLASLMTDADGDLVFGGAGAGGGGYSSGRMQGVGLWGRVLTADERTWLYQSGTAARTYAEVAAYTG
jgi:hypothetical protein